MCFHHYSSLIDTSTTWNYTLSLHDALPIYLIPYRWGFGVDTNRPTEMDLTETVRFLFLLEELKIPLVNITAGSPYYNPHIQRPALCPPSDGYQPAEDPLVGVARQMGAGRELKGGFPV